MKMYLIEHKNVEIKADRLRKNDVIVIRDNKYYVKESCKLDEKLKVGSINGNGSLIKVKVERVHGGAKKFIKVGKLFTEEECKLVTIS